MEKLKCSKSECKRVLKKAKDMSNFQISAQNIKCSSCGNWIFKETDYANETYNEVSNLYAIQFNKKFINN